LNLFSFFALFSNSFVWTEEWCHAYHCLFSFHLFMLANLRDKKSHFSWTNIHLSHIYLCGSEMVDGKYQQYCWRKKTYNKYLRFQARLDWRTKYYSSLTRIFKKIFHCIKIQ
jgi:hypothetical protein